MFISANNILIRKWWVILILIDLLLISFTIAHPHLPDFPQKWRLITPFSLHGENSIAVWWSGITLLLAAILCFDRYRNFSLTDKYGWLALSLVLAGLSLDEIGSLHERISLIAGWSGMIPFALILFSLVTYALFILYRQKKTKINAIYILIAFILYGSVALQEFIEHLYTWPSWSIGLRVGIEEGCELLGTFLIIFAALYQKEKNNSNRLLSLFPTLTSLTDLKYILAIGLMIHIIGSYLFLEFFKTGSRGNPMNWYPVSACFCSFMICVWNSVNSKTSNKICWNLLIITCLLSSIGIMTNIFIVLLPGINHIISTAVIQDKFALFYLLQLITISLLIFKFQLIKNPMIIASVILTPALVILSIWQDNTWLRYTILGIVSYLTFLLCLSAVKKLNYANF